MDADHYNDFTSQINKNDFMFTSEGPKGKINKLVRFARSGNPDILNLSFGNLKENGVIDDEAIDNNDDRDKIIATIIAIVKDFTLRNPDKFIFFSGRTPSRTRLFRIILWKYIESIRKDFHVYGVINENNKLMRVPFIKNVNYFGFLIKRKLVK